MLENEIIKIFIIAVGLLLANKDIRALYRTVASRFLPHDIKVREQIQDVLDELLIKLGAARINIWQFNNGTRSLSGYSYKFSSIIFESFDRHNLISLKRDFQNLPVEDYSVLLVRLQDCDKYITNTIDSDIPFVRAMYTTVGVKTGIEFKLNNKDIYKGFISVSFYDKITVTESMIREIETSIALVNQYIKNIKTLS